MATYYSRIDAMNKTWIQLICGACLSAAGMTVLRAAEIQVARAVNTTTNPSNKAVVSNDGKAPLLTPAPIVENELAAQDPKQAFEHHLATAEKGDAEAQFQLGQCYEKGKGVELDARKAYDWYRKSAEQEHAKAQMALGGLYYLGRGVERDYEESAKWWKLAAEQNEVKAHINLANLHLIGLGVEPIIHR